MRVLHAGCGGSGLPAEFAGCDEVRLDACADFAPDVQASITDMGDVGEFDCVYSSHVLEHLHPHELPLALAEFWRVLKPGGVMLAYVPDLEDVAPTDDVLFDSPAGPITGRDMYYGKGSLVEASPFMAHHNGFTKTTLAAALECAGFEVTIARIPILNLMAFGRKGTA